MSLSGEKMGTSDVRPEQPTLIQYCFESGIKPLDTLKKVSKTRRTLLECITGFSIQLTFEISRG